MSFAFKEAIPISRALLLSLLLVFWNSITTRITITEYCERWSCCSSKFGGLARSSPLLKVEEAAAAALVVIDEAVGGAAFKPRMLFSSRLLETASLLETDGIRLCYKLKLVRIF